jgi:hypothetical protein
VVQPTNRSPLDFEAQTKKLSRWFWGPNHQTEAVSFEAKPGETVATSFEAKLEKIVAVGFETKPLETVAAGFGVKPLETATAGFEAKPLETVTTSFEAKPAKTVWVVLRPNTHKPSSSVLRPKLMRNRPSGFEAKPMTNRWHWFWGSTKKPTLLVFTCTVQTAHGVTQPLDRPATEYPISATIFSPLHQVSYSCHDPHRCTSCRTCHLHSTRQANAIL